jgi:NAD(P)-dependent dehydrogenase (short-subunit alcohol dehydrogenase family)
MSKVWFITGTSRGFGRQFATAALERGDRVVATARNVDTLKDLVDTYGESVLTLALDVADRSAVGAAVASAYDRFGRLDVVVNNAGYGLFGAVEELTEDEVRAQMEANFFGALWVTQAVLPLLREQGSGHIVQISSVGGIVAFPTVGGYHASKWALEGMTEALAQEVAGFGNKVTLVEPGGYNTDWGGSSAVHATPLPDYQPLRDAMQAETGSWQIGDPGATGPAMLKVVDADQPPPRIIFGSQSIGQVRALYAQRLQTWTDWEALSMEAQGN